MKISHDNMARMKTWKLWTKWTERGARGAFHFHFCNWLGTRGI